MATNPAKKVPWRQRLSEHCAARGFAAPMYQDVSDRRGGRTAWSSIVTVNGMQFPARFFFDLAQIENSREDAAEIALRHLTGVTSQQQDPPPASYYMHRAQVA